MAKLTQAYIEDSLKWIRLDKEIVHLEGSELNLNEEKLKKKLMQEKIKNPRIIGVVESKNVFLALYDNNTFSGVVWTSHTPLKGLYVVA